MDWGTLISGAVGGGTLASIVAAWLTSRSTNHSTNRSVDADLAKHWTKTMGELVDALRDELHEARQKVVDYLELKEKLAHLEEALDHIYAMLNAEGDVEVGAAQKRAQAFLRRMRPDPVQAKGEQRQDAQRKVSKARIERDAEQGKID